MDFPVRPPVPGISGRPPWTPGQLLSDPDAAKAPAQLTAFELAELTKLGWKPGDPLPSVAAQAKRVAAEATTPLPVDPATAPPPLVPPDPVDISSLPPPVRDELLAWMASVGQAVSPPTAESSPSSSVTTPPVTTPDSLDAVEYLRAILAGEPFRREYSLFGGAIQVEFRTSTGNEETQHVSGPAWAAMTRVTVNGVATVLPDAKPGSRDQWVALVPSLQGNHVEAAVCKVYKKFVALIEALTDAADDPNFWPAIAR